MDGFFQNSEKFIKEFAAPKSEPKKIDASKPTEYDAFFKVYASPSGEAIEMEGMMKLYKDLGVSMEDVITLIIPYYCKMQDVVFL